MEKAVNGEYAEGIRDNEQRPWLVSDNGCQPTSLKFIKHMALLGIEQIFIFWNNPKGNAETERFMRTMKEYLFWRRKYDNSLSLKSHLRSSLSFTMKIIRTVSWNIRVFITFIELTENNRISLHINQIYSNQLSAWQGGAVQFQKSLKFLMFTLLIKFLILV